MSTSANSFKMPVSKRLLDIAASLVALPFLAVATLIMTLIMKVTSPGPVFFLQERVGYRGRRFKIYKFRTMITGANTGVHQAYFSQLMGSSAPMIKMDSKGDSRLIPGGWMLRASGLDELPQIINVLRGDMSLVGPRPCLPYEYEGYLPWQRKRFSTTPGLTGLWQVSGKNRTTFDEMIRLDIQYAEEHSFWLDLKIILMTVPALLQQIGDTRSRRQSMAQSRPTAATMPAEAPKGVYSQH
jgi:lipopolysaccharide/colanic/teichoic acid biosynthesis glycosyltransferase